LSFCLCCYGIMFNDRVVIKKKREEEMIDGILFSSLRFLWNCVCESWILFMELIFLIIFCLFSYIFYNVPINILARTANRNSVPTMYTPYVPDSLKVAYRILELVPRTEANHELCGIAHNWIFWAWSKWHPIAETYSTYGLTNHR